MATLKWLKNGNNYYYFDEAPTHISSITLNTSSIALNEVGATYQLTATVSPNAAVETHVFWHSSDESVAYVDSNGLVYCVSVGQATITASCDGLTATCSVDYTHVTGVTLNKNSISLTTAGKTEQLVATVNPSGAYNKSVTWSSSNTNVATVSDTGLVTCVTPGSCTITVTTVDGGYTATCNIVINFATQGPCPDGFHVPLKDEWQAIYSAFTSAGGSSYSDFAASYKLPPCGWRQYDNGATAYQNQVGIYWSSSRYDYLQGYRLYYYNNSIQPQSTQQTTYGAPIRPFKNTAVVPDSSWTIIKQNGNAKICYKSSLGLISATSNGSDWITISDKNLGATQVWNSGATLSEANAGKYYQWGNNYGFPFTGGVSTSSTRVNASSYGPGNYYSSSTFITTSSSYPWESGNYNYNLRGGEDGNVPI